MSSMSPAVMQALGAFMATLPDDVNNQGKQAMQQQAVQQQAQGGTGLNVRDRVGESQVDAVDAADRGRSIVAEGTNAQLAEIDSQAKHELAAAKIKTDEDTRIAEAQANPWRSMLDEVDILQNTHKQAQAAGEKNAMKAYDNYLRSVDDYSNQRVYNWWGEAGTGAKILGVLSQMFAGASQGLSGQNGPTPLDRVIEQDLQMQKLGLAKKGQDVENSRGVYADLKLQLKDEAAAHSAALEIAYTSTLKRAEAIVKANPTAANKAALGQLEQQILAKRAAKREERYADYVKNGVSQAMQDAGVSTQWGGIWSNRLTADQANGLASQEQVKGGVAGFPGSEHLDPTIKTKLSDAVGNGKAALGTLSHMHSLLAEHQNGRLSYTDFITGLKQESAALQGSLKDVLALGALSGPDQTLLQDLIGTNASFFENLRPGKSTKSLAVRLDKAKNIIRTLVLGRAHGSTVGGQPLRSSDPDFPEEQQ